MMIFQLLLYFVPKGAEEGKKKDKDKGKGRAQAISIETLDHSSLSVSLSLLFPAFLFFPRPATHMRGREREPQQRSSSRQQRPKREGIAQKVMPAGHSNLKFYQYNRTLTVYLYS